MHSRANRKFAPPNLAYGHNHVRASGRRHEKHRTMPPKIVVDTRVLVAALLRARDGTASSRVLRRCLQRHCQPLIGAKLSLEGEAVLARAELFRRCPLSLAERHEFFAGFAAVCEWVAAQPAGRRRQSHPRTGGRRRSRDYCHTKHPRLSTAGITLSRDCSFDTRGISENGEMTWQP